MTRAPAARAFVALPWRGRARLAGRLMRDRRVPLAARLAFVLLVAYLLSPVDLVPDFIPVLGYVDDVLVLLLALWLFARLLPEGVVQEHLADLSPGKDAPARPVKSEAKP